MRTGSASSNLLERQDFYTRESLTTGQLRLDANLQNFSHEASDVSNLLAMTTGSFAYRFARAGLMSVGLAKSASTVFALGFEVSAFRGSSNFLARARGFTPTENVFDSRGWFTTFTHFASLKGAGYLARGQNLFLTHSLQSLGMVGGHQLAYAMNLSIRPQGTFFEQMMEAEVTNLALGAGNALMGRLTGHRLNHFERLLDLQEASMERSSFQRRAVSLQMPSMAAEALGREPAVLDEEAVNDFWRSHTQPQGKATEYFRQNPEARRLFRALQNADQELRGQNISQREYLNAVLKNLKITQGVSAFEYKTRYSILEASERFDTALKAFVSAEGRGLFERHLARYRVENQGGKDWGLEVNGGAPRQALEAALDLLPTDASGKLIEMEGGRSLEVRLRAAREILDQAHVKLVSVWGAGRHGLALGDWVRQAAGNGEMIDEKYVIPIMLGHRADFTHELNIDGTHERNLSGIPINEPGRLALRAAMPRENDAYLALSETVVVTLPSSKLKEQFTPEKVRLFSGNTQLIFAIKSVLDGGESVPGYVMESLARWGRFDLMVNAAFQSGLGFPREMFGISAPDAPVNLAVDAMNIEAALRAARTLAGDKAKIGQDSVNKRTLTSPNKRIDAGVLVFKGAYGGFIKNFIAPGVGYKLMEYYVQNIGHVTSAMMRSKLATLRTEAQELSERIFNEFEADAIRREVDRVGEVLLHSQADQDSAQRRQALDWIGKVKARLDKYRDRDTATEDLLGCTRIRDMDVFIQIVGDLLSSKGLTFERRFGEFTARVRSQASSGNFAYGLLEPVYLALVAKGMLVERPKRDFTVEGISGLPHAETRWGSQPDFVKETLAWVHPDPEPRGRPPLHSSGLRLHALRVTRDLVDEIEEHSHPVLLNDLSSAAQASHIQSMLMLGREMIERLRHEQEQFPPVNDDVGQRIRETLADFDQFLLRGERSLKQLNLADKGLNSRVKRYVVAFRRVLVEVREQLSGSEDWIAEDSMQKIRIYMEDALKALNPSP